MKYSCDTCKTAFHFKKQLHYHLVWSPTCGLLKGMGVDDKFEIRSPGDSSVLEIKKEIIDKKASDNLSIVRLNVTSEISIVLVNCENLVDTDLFVKRTKRSRCGICAACEIHTDCSSCVMCCKKQNLLSNLNYKDPCERSKATPIRPCVKRQCINPIFNVSKATIY